MLPPECISTQYTVQCTAHVTYICEWRMANANGKLNGRKKQKRNVRDNTQRVLLTTCACVADRPWSFVRSFVFFLHKWSCVCVWHSSFYYYYYDSMQFYIITLNSFHSVRCVRVASDSFFSFSSLFLFEFIADVNGWMNWWWWEWEWEWCCVQFIFDD